MSSPFYKLLWTLLHLLVDLIEAIFFFGLEFRENFLNCVKNITKVRRIEEKEDDAQLIEGHTSHLKKLPKHLAVIVNAENANDVDLRKLTNLVLWSMNSGVHFISFYDHKGILKHELSSSFCKSIDQHVKQSDGENIVWGPNFQNPSDPSGIKFPHRNGYKKHIVVNLYSSEDGQAKFDELLTREFCSGQQITIDKVDETLSKVFGHIPDPDLAVYFGVACCTMGFMPWQIRLTEFIPISYKLQHLSLEKYLRVLYKYAKCEQRFGK